MERNGIKRRIVILRGPLLVAGWLAFPLVGVAICGISGLPFWIFVVDPRLRRCSEEEKEKKKKKKS